MRLEEGHRRGTRWRTDSLQSRSSAKIGGHRLPSDIKKKAPGGKIAPLESGSDRRTVLTGDRLVAPETWTLGGTQESRKKKC